MPIPLRQEFRVPGLNEPISHYTDAVRFGTLLFVSGIGHWARTVRSSARTTQPSRHARSFAIWTRSSERPGPRPRTS